MSIKRYVPKYKILAKLKSAVWLEKRKKINLFARQKWNGKKKLYFPRKVKIFDQDSATYPVGFDFESDRVIKLKKTYKQSLLDKQAFQLYYGARRLKNYQLKHIGLYAKRLGLRNKISPARIFYHLMENRLAMSLYRLGIVSTLSQARRLQATNKVKVGKNLVKNLGYNLRQNDTIKLEYLKSLEILARYLKFNAPFYYFNIRENRKQGFFFRKEYLKNSYLYRSQLGFFCLNKPLLVGFNPQKSLIDFSLLTKPKSFVKKFDINTLLGDIISCSEKLGAFFPDNQIKISSYKLLKLLKQSKTNFYPLDLLGWKFQLNGFYTSSIEIKKKRILKYLREKISLSNNQKLVLCFLKSSLINYGPLKKRKNFFGLSKGLTKFEDFYSDYSSIAVNRRIFFETLKSKRFFSRIFFSRLFLYAAKGKKKYKSSFYFVFKRKRKIDSLFHIGTLSSLKFKQIRKLRRKFYKKMVWKIKKQKKWKRQIRVSFSLFRLRQKLSQVFYVPKHFEINYKTLAVNYLGYTDPKTTNTKIAFWFNLRKLLTFIT